MLDKEKMKAEADAYFIRNKDSLLSSGHSIGMEIFSEFYDRFDKRQEGKRLLEVGCSFGQNLFYMSKEKKVDCYGVEPSAKAVKYGNELAVKENLKVKLVQGFSDLLPYDDDYFDVVYLGFCLYQVDRHFLFRTLSEADRVLKSEGFLAITDFDTPLKYKRENKHNPDIFTYKRDYAQYLLSFGFTLIEKRMYAHGYNKFIPEVQERVSTQIFFKELESDLYVQI